MAQRTFARPRRYVPDVGIRAAGKKGEEVWSGPGWQRGVEREKQRCLRYCAIGKSIHLETARLLCLRGNAAMLVQLEWEQVAEHEQA